LLAQIIYYLALLLLQLARNTLMNTFKNNKH
jgi:hypothetical protein